MQSQCFLKLIVILDGFLVKIRIGSTTIIR
jgi:hypothetical protein